MEGKTELELAHNRIMNLMRNLEIALRENEFVSSTKKYYEQLAIKQSKIIDELYEIKEVQSNHIKELKKLLGHNEESF